MRPMQDSPFPAWLQPSLRAGMKALDRIGEALKKRGLSLDEIIESGREVRGQMMQEKYGISEDNKDQ
jgi:hypothetical protein